MSAATTADSQTVRRPKGTLLCWLGVFGNGLLLVVILAFVVLTMLRVRLSFGGGGDDGELTFRLVYSAILAMSFGSWLVSAAVYKLRRVRVDSDNLGVTLGLMLLIPVSMAFLFVSATLVLSG